MDAASAPGSGAGLTSVIVPCFNELAFARLCVAAVARHTGYTDPGLQQAKLDRDEAILWEAVLNEYPGDPEAAAELARLGSLAAESASVPPSESVPEERPS